LFFCFFCWAHFFAPPSEWRPRRPPIPPVGKTAPAHTHQFPFIPSSQLIFSILFPPSLCWDTHCSFATHPHCCYRRTRRRVDVNSKPVEAAYYRLAPRGPRGISERRGMYLNQTWFLIISSQCNFLAEGSRFLAEVCTSIIPPAPSRRRRFKDLGWYTRAYINWNWNVSFKRSHLCFPRRCTSAAIFSLPPASEKRHQIIRIQTIFQLNHQRANKHQRGWRRANAVSRWSRWNVNRQNEKRLMMKMIMRRDCTTVFFSRGVQPRGISHSPSSGWCGGVRVRFRGSVSREVGSSTVLLNPPPLISDARLLISPPRLSKRHY